MPDVDDAEATLPPSPAGRPAEAAGAEPAADPLLGRTLGSYRLVRRLGEGGMGAVYLAEHPGIGSRVAIKILHPRCAADRSLVERFFNEARAVNLIRHHNIVQILDFNETEDHLHYFVMEFLEGVPLQALVQGGQRLPAAGYGPIVLQCCRALQAAHEHGIVHRDLKPDNVFLVTREDRANVVKIVDFGIAKLSEPGPGGRTQTGTVMGTPAYMSPEQAAGETGAIDARSDVYTLGVILFQLATGRLPFGGSTTSFRKLILAHLREPPPRPRALEPSIPPEIEALILRALEKEPEHRFQSMEELHDAMLTCLTGLGLSPDPPPAAKGARRAGAAGPPIAGAPTPGPGTPPAGRSAVEAPDAAATLVRREGPDAAATLVRRGGPDAAATLVRREGPDTAATLVRRDAPAAGPEQPAPAVPTVVWSGARAPAEAVSTLETVRREPERRTAAAPGRRWLPVAVAGGAVVAAGIAAALLLRPGRVEPARPAPAAAEAPSPGSGQGAGAPQPPSTPPPRAVAPSPPAAVPAPGAPAPGAPAPAAPAPAGPAPAAPAPAAPAPAAPAPAAPAPAAAAAPAPAAPAPVRAPPRTEKGNGLSLVVPADWERKELKSGPMFRPPGLPDGAVVALLVLPPGDTYGGFQDWFSERWRSLTEGQEPDPAARPRFGATKKGRAWGRIGAALGKAAGKFEYRWFWAARDGDKARIIIGKADRPDLLDRYRAQIEAVLDSAEVEK